MNKKRSPVLIIGGFLGSGKTTLLKHILSNLEDELSRRQCVLVTDNWLSACGEISGVNVIIDATGTTLYAFNAAKAALESKKHFIAQAELDATYGCLLASFARKHNVIFTAPGGDQPGALMNLQHEVEFMGFRPLLLGNVKGFLDTTKCAKDLEKFAIENGQNEGDRTMLASFADGTKLSMEMAVTANATGFKVATRGMLGPKCSHVDDAPKVFPRQLLDSIANDADTRGIIDYVLGASPGPGVFIVASFAHHAATDHAEKNRQVFMRYVKLGEGPYYVFYVPYHLHQFELPITIGKMILCNETTCTSLDKPVVHVIAMAKRDLKKGDCMGSVGSDTCYGVCENADVVHAEQLVPLGICGGLVLITDVRRDTPLQFSHFSSESVKKSAFIRVWRELEDCALSSKL